MPPNPSLLKSPTQRDGAYYEKMAAEFLQAQGLVLLSQNWQQPKVGEIDLVLLHLGRSWHTLVFAEVRKRTVSCYGDAITSITKAKQRKLIKTARYFMQHHPQYADLECRFDVIGFNPLQSTREPNRDSMGASKNEHYPEWIQGAFIASAW